jgi:hypothetical protein
VYQEHMAFDRLKNAEEKQMMMLNKQADDPDVAGIGASSSRRTSSTLASATTRSRR